MTNPYAYEDAGDLPLSPDLEPITPEDGDFGAAQPDTRNRAQSAPEMSVLGPTLVFKGELTAGEDLLIQGRVEGSIRHNERNLTVGPEGSVKANIHARNIIIQGRVEGDLHCTEGVTIETSARVQGNIFAPRVGLKEGAWFKGRIDMDAEAQSSRGKERERHQGKRKKGKGDLSPDKMDDLIQQSEPESDS